MGSIYHAFDVTNGKAYIGQTWHWPDRIKQHLKGDSCFDRALKKRSDKFIWSVLISDLKTQDDLDAAEDAFILELKTIHPDGYNIRRGGSKGLMHEESKEKCRKANIGRHAGNKNPMYGKPGTRLGVKGELHPLFGKRGTLCKNTGKKRTAEQIKHLSEAHRGQISWMKGRHHTSESKEKLRQAVLGKKRGPYKKRIK